MHSVTSAGMCKSYVNKLQEQLLGKVLMEAVLENHGGVNYSNCRDAPKAAPQTKLKT